MSGIDNWRSLREACEKYGATSITVPALVAAVRDEAARDAGRAHAAFALECAAEDFEVEQRAKARAEGALHPWSEAVTFLAARAAALRAAPPTEAPREGNA